MRTVKQISEMLGCSKQAVFKRLQVAGIHPQRLGPIVILSDRDIRKISQPVCKTRQENSRKR